MVDPDLCVPLLCSLYDVQSWRARTTCASAVPNHLFCDVLVSPSHVQENARRRRAPFTRPILIYIFGLARPDGLTLLY